MNKEFLFNCSKESIDALIGAFDRTNNKNWHRWKIETRMNALLTNQVRIVNMFPYVEFQTEEMIAFVLRHDTDSFRKIKNPTTEHLATTLQRVVAEQRHYIVEEIIAHWGKSVPPEIIPEALYSSTLFSSRRIAKWVPYDDLNFVKKMIDRVHEYEFSTLLSHIKERFGYKQENVSRQIIELLKQKLEKIMTEKIVNEKYVALNYFQIESH